MTLIYAKNQTYAVPDAPTQCGACGAMSGVFINRQGNTSCCRCTYDICLLHGDSRPCQHCRADQKAKAA